MVQPTLILTRSDLRRLVSRADYLCAVEDGFRASADGRVHSPQPLHIEVPGGGLHAKGAAILGGRAYAVVKVNSNFPLNPRQHDLPTIQGALLLFDGSNGALLAVMDSAEITVMRTAAATALAARYLARDDARTLTICGCGVQAGAQAAALADVRAFERGFAWDADPARAERFAHDMSLQLGFPMEARVSLREASLESDVIVTCTTASQPFLDREAISPGVFIAAIGADAPSKNEIAPALMADASVFADVAEQAIVMGDSRHAIAAGTLNHRQMRGELADLLSGRSLGRTADAEIIIFDSTGTAIEDVASAAMAYERAVASDVRRVELAE